MVSRIAPDPVEWTVADLHQRFGPILHSRIRQVPAPGTATVEDVVRINDHENRLCELVDGILVEKTVGWIESCLAMRIGQILGEFVEAGDLGMVAGEAGMMEIAPELVRIPDVSFVSLDRLPGGCLPGAAAPRIVPDLAVEVLSRSNTKREMEEKLDDYFENGVRIVWYVDPVSRSVRVYTTRDESRLLGEGDSLDGGEVLPGFVLPVARIFKKPERTTPAPQPPGSP